MRVRISLVIAATCCVVYWCCQTGASSAASIPWVSGDAVKNALVQRTSDRPHKKRYVLLHSLNSDWELDYIVKDVMDDGTSYEKEVVLWNQKEGRNFSFLQDFRKEVGERPLAIGLSVNVLSCWEVENMLRILQPTVVFVLGDELKNEYCKHNAAVQFGRVVFRQYNVPPFGYRKPYHLMILGTKTNTFQGAVRGHSVKPPSERQFVWRHIGNVQKSDRGEMVRALSTILWNSILPTAIPEKEVQAIYEDSVFVPVGRGHQNLDCFRLYEALRAGAIPIVVGSEAEILKTFTGRPGWKGLPPMVVGTSWNDAAKNAKTLLGDAVALLQLQRKTAAYFDSVTMALRKLFFDAIGQHYKGV